MAIDSAAKRFSAIHHGSPWRGIAVLPDGTIGQADRQAVSFLYSGISAVANQVLGPLRIAAAECFIPGAFAAESFIPGPQAAECFIPGAVAAETP